MKRLHEEAVEEAVEEAAAELYLTRHSSGLRGRQKHANAVTTILLCRDPYTHFVQKRAGPNMQKIPH